MSNTREYKDKKIPKGRLKYLEEKQENNEIQQEINRENSKNRNEEKDKMRIINKSRGGKRDERQQLFVDKQMEEYF